MFTENCSYKKNNMNNEIQFKYEPNIKITAGELENLLDSENEYD